jgi:hypothetical protein
MALPACQALLGSFTAPGAVAIARGLRLRNTAVNRSPEFMGNCICPARAKFFLPPTPLFVSEGSLSQCESAWPPLVSEC